jgi:hypothetical protein
LRQRFDVACCDTGEQFRREARAITRAGQIKDPSGRHEKDDRSRIDDRSRYVLGWSNADKLRTLRDQRERLEAEAGNCSGSASARSSRRALICGVGWTTLEQAGRVHALCGYRLDEPGPPDCVLHRGARAAGSGIRHPARVGAPARGRAGASGEIEVEALRRVGQAG